MKKTLLASALGAANHAAAAPLACLIEPDKVAEVGARVGVVDKIMVERGDSVAADLARAKAACSRHLVSVGFISKGRGQGCDRQDRVSGPAQAAAGELAAFPRIGAPSLPLNVRRPSKFPTIV
jgi:hypothetical protein